MTPNLPFPELLSGTWPASAPLPGQPLPTALEADLAVVAWLETAPHQLSAACTDHILVALLDWSTGGQRWPEPTAPTDGRPSDHLEILVQATRRLRQHALAAPSRSARYQLAALVRGLGLAIACQRDPAAVAEEQWRATVRRQPWRADAPAPIQLRDGRVL